ncbi:MAG: DrmE family protein [Clostridia bacterium]|nr:DrmE family protein [Clostridia bacterium]
MFLSQILDNYVKDYLIYGKIKYSKSSKEDGESLHPLFILTQYIIDKFISEGNKRIAIVLPDNECNILPLIIAKYFANIQYESNYAGSVLEDIEIGQHIRLGKAVVEFGGIIDNEDEKRKLGLSRNEKYIKFKTGRKDQTTVYCPINGVHYLFEKTEAALSLYKVWNGERKKAEERIKESKSVIDELKIKRTALRKTITLLSAKNEFKDFMESIYVCGRRFEDVATYGEIDCDSEEKFKLFNKGRLDCLPSISVTHKMEDLYYLLKDKWAREKIYAIVSTMDKFDEIINNPDAFKRVLKHNVPFVVFVSESDFDGCPVLTDFGFELWHWKPSTMKSEAFLLSDEVSRSKIQRKEIFGNFSAKINRAALSEFSLETHNNKNLKTMVKLISRLSKDANDADNVIRQLIRKFWAFQNKLTWMTCKIERDVLDKLKKELQEITDIWSQHKLYYGDQQISTIIEEIIKIFNFVITESVPDKYYMLCKFIDRIAQEDKDITILVPNKYEYVQQTFNEINLIRGSCRIKVRTLVDFYEVQSKNYESTDYLIVTWFDKDEYIKIKQTYCYDNLVFTLYDYENRWRENFISRFDECIPHESIKRVAQKVQFSSEDIADKPFDKITLKTDEDFEDISDYSLPSKIIKSTLGNSGIERDSAEAIESIPIILSEDKIAYFYPTHNVIDVTALSKGDGDRPTKKDAVKLKKGDKILIRQSDRDIIREKADILMVQNGESELRGKVEIWFTLLGDYAKGRSIADVCRALNAEGGKCTFQQVRFWLSGETIVPREKDILIAIGIVASKVPKLNETCEKYLRAIDDIYEVGRKVQGYHQSAGRWLTSELKNKAQEIKAIANSRVSHGEVEGIGEIHIYTVEEILDKEITERGRINKLEDLY